MRSRAERRVPWERAARAAAFVFLAAALVRLVAALGGDQTPRLHVRFDGGVDARTRDSLAALRRAGQSVSWSGIVEPLAAMAEPAREPSMGTRITLVADHGAALADDLGALDSLGAGGGTLTASGLRGTLAVRERGTEAQTSAKESVALGRVLVLARASWEAKFVIAALEEAGWVVDARLRLSDTMRVTQGSLADPSISTHAAVVVLDTAVGGVATAVARFVRSGGGLVLAGEGAVAPAFTALAPARVVRLMPPRVRTFEGTEPLDALPRYLLGAPRRDAVTLDARHGALAVAARREGGGRVVQAGYAETWRWRMQGEAGSVPAHRAYWTRLVAAAAAATYSTVKSVAADDGAPLAATVHAIGEARPAAPPPSRSEEPPPAWVGLAILLFLVGEWASRRTRGAA